MKKSLTPYSLVLTWEYRMGEIDFSSCERNEVVVMGTNETHPDLLMFDYLGPLCAKKLFDLSIEIFNSKILIIGGGKFGINIAKYLVKWGSEVLIICDEDKEITGDIGSKKVGNLSKFKLG